MHRLLPVVLAVAVLAGLAGEAARADADPASDVLYFQDVFLPYARPSPDVGTKLTAAVAAANRAGFRIKVAVIAAEQDLGGVSSLFGRPDVYAHFLGVELKSFYTQRLLVVMPAGFGIYDNGKPTDAEKTALASIMIASPDPDGLTNSATAAVGKLRQTIGTGTRKDAIAPAVAALASTGTKGGRATLRFSVYDASGKAREIVRVYGPALLLFATISKGFAKAKPKQKVAVVWKVPADLQTTKLKFCVLAQDAAGNQSKTSCAALKID